MDNLAVWPWRINEEGHGDSRSITVDDSDGFSLCQMLEYKGRPRNQAIEHAVLFSASRTMWKMIEDSDGMNDKAVMKSLRDLADLCKRRAAGYGRPDKRDMTPNAKLTGGPAAKGETK